MRPRARRGRGRGSRLKDGREAVQVVEGKLTCVVAASTDIKLAKAVQLLFAQPSMRITLSRDVQGVEVCGALKNVLAIAAGIVEGKELGSNALAAVVRPPLPRDRGSSWMVLHL